MAFGEGLHGTQPKKKRTQLYVLGAAAALVIVFVIIRRSSGATATSGVDPQQIAADAAAQQQAADQQAYGTPSTFADNGASAGALADAVTQGLSGVQDALTNLEQANQGTQTGGSTPTTAAPSDTAPTNNVTIVNAPGQPKSNGAKPSAGKRVSGGKAPAAGAIPAPFGPKKPPAKPGYTIRGTGGGNWWYVPHGKKTGGKTETVVKNFGSGQKRSGGKKTNAHSHY